MCCLAVMNPPFTYYSSRNAACSSLLQNVLCKSSLYVYVIITYITLIIVDLSSLKWLQVPQQLFAAEIMVIFIWSYSCVLFYSATRQASEWAQVRGQSCGWSRTTAGSSGWWKQEQMCWGKRNQDCLWSSPFFEMEHVSDSEWVRAVKNQRTSRSQTFRSKNSRDVSCRLYAKTGA